MNQEMFMQLNLKIYLKSLISEGNNALHKKKQLPKRLSDNMINH